ncbi:hypothetical protein [Metabacillus sp. FJAT-52054]|uniref:Lipoprotein n=1 Tax=Metabacillus sediminis TaxID=3117746 RepID=A0ABZ2NGK3_9BACI
MKKRIRAGFWLGAIPFLMVAGCSEAATSQETMPEMNEESKLTSKDPYYDTESIASSPRFALSANYKEIEPSKKAKPLETNYTKEQLAKITVAEAHGGSRERSVPLGQTLHKDVADQTEGPLKDSRIVAFYGNPNSINMGILGEHSPEDLMDKLMKQTRAYSELDPERPAIPAIELITTIAQRTPGDKGLYVHYTPEADIEKYAKLAEENNALLFLDVQLGRDSIMNQVKALEKYLKKPNIHLAIDTEFHVKQGQVPGENLGHVDGKNVQEAIKYVSKLAAENGLPDKVVVVHQFADKIISNKSAIQPAENVEVVLNSDGFGAPSLKTSGYHLLVQSQPIQYGGFKLFFKNDKPVMTPKEVLALDPAPSFINYQ